MILTVHSVVGAAIVNQCSFKWWAYLLAFFSHFFLDLLPHREYSIKKLEVGWRKKEFWQTSGKIFLDFLGGFIFITLFAENLKNLSYLFLGGFFAILPDALNALSWLLKDKLYLNFFSGKKLEIFDQESFSFPLYYKIHLALHFNKEQPPSLILGIINQLIIFLTALFLL